MLSHSQKYAKAYQKDFPIWLEDLRLLFDGSWSSYQILSVTLTETNSQSSWKWMVGRRSFPFWISACFQGLVLFVSAKGSIYRSLFTLHPRDFCPPEAELDNFMLVSCWALVSLSNQSHIQSSNFRILPGPQKFWSPVFPRTITALGDGQDTFTVSPGPFGRDEALDRGTFRPSHQSSRSYLSTCYPPVI